MNAISPPGLALFGALAVLAACDGGTEDPGPVVGGGGGAAGHGGGMATGGDEGDQCADALPLQPQENSLGGVYYEHHGVLDPPGDPDSYRFTAEAGQWFAMVTEANPEADPSKIDTVLTLRDETGSVQLAQSDDAAPPWRSDSEIIHRFAEGGSYCLQVLEHADLVGSAPRGGPSFTYRLLVYPVDFERYDDWNLDAEPNDELDEAQQLSVVPYQGAPSTRIVGQLTMGDVDYARFVSSPVGDLLEVAFTPSGPTGNGASLGPGLVRLRQADGEGSILAELDYQSRPAEGYLPEPQPFGIAALVAPGQPVLLEVAPPAGASPGPEDFYALTLQTYGLPALDPEPNDDPSTAFYTELLDQEPGVRAYSFGDLLPAGDVDWWSIGIHDAGTAVELSCASWQLGSSLRDATFALVGSDTAQPLQTQTETQHTTVRWSDDPAKLPTMPAVVLLESGAHYVQVTATQYDPGIESVYYACRVTAREP